MRRRWFRDGLMASTAAVVGLAVPSGATGMPAATRSSSDNPYFTAPFTTTSNRYTFGQNPSWTADGRVLSNENDGTGVQQIYVSKLDGSNMKCLTCGQPGPNGFPQERPQGDWILFCSWRGQAVALGAPCLGGYGTDMYVMRPDGSKVTRLTAPGAAFEKGGVYDNYHPAWSPDGKRIVWTHEDFLSLQSGGAQWTMLVADFVHDAGPPRLANVTVVGPAGDTAYETHVWAPDGSGFLYTLFSSPDEKSGWLNSELYFMRLSGRGASLAHPKATHLTDNHPGWDEQAVFTPDMKNVIWMSSRATPTWYQTVVTGAQMTGFRPPMQNEVFGPLFFDVILDPRFRTDLYELDLSSHAIRRLTDLDSVIPEFYFDASGRRILWSEGGGKATKVGRFGFKSAPATRAPKIKPVTAWIGAPRNGDNSRPASSGHPNGIGGPSPAPIPPVFVEAASLLRTQFDALTRQLGGLPQGPSCCSVAPG